MNAKTPGYRGKIMRFGSMLVVTLGIAIAYNGANNSFAASATFTGLGTLPGGSYTSSEAWDVSANGTVVVGESRSAAGTEAFRWTATDGMTGLGDLAGGIFHSRAIAVSGDGSVIAGSGESDPGGTEAFRWTTTGGMTGLGDLTGGKFLSFATSVSHDGSTVVGSSESASGMEAFLWTANSNMTGLGDLTGGSFLSRAYDVSDDGAVVVGQSASETGLEGFRYSPGTGMTGLNNFSQRVFRGVARGVSGDGNVVVGQSFSDFPTKGFRYNNGDLAFRWTGESGMATLGSLPSEDYVSRATVATVDGSVVVGWIHNRSTHVLDAFIWTADTGLRSLKDMLIQDYGLDLSGWTLTNAHAISADGTTIVGAGINPSGNLEAWRAYIPALRICWAEVKNDGIDQDCNGLDLTIEITTARYNARKKTVLVEATSSLQSAANLQVDGYGPMKWNHRRHLWKLKLRRVTSNPGIITVSGIEGSESTTVTVK